MYNLLVSHQFEDWEGEAFQFSKSRFLEYTTDAIRDQLRSLSVEAIECLKSWPCVLMEEGRGEELVRIGRLIGIRDLGSDLRLMIDLCATKAPILNDHVWRIRNELDIEQFEFSRNHWSVKERDLLTILDEAGHSFDSAIDELFESKPLPTPPRSELISARDVISEWGHTQIDDFLLEAGVEGLDAGRPIGSRRDRANAIIKFALQNPTATTAENSLLSAHIARATNPGARRVSEDDSSRSEAEEVHYPAPPMASETTDRTANRVFIVHGQNKVARSAVLSFLDSIGLVGIVLHEQPNMGRHLLTKFIEEAEVVTFAIVLMTDDDVGGLKDRDLAPRARQNVILELGYFLSHLGQERVCALITPGLETPSDFDGIVYIRMDDEDRWQHELKRELLAARMPVAGAGSSSPAG